MDGFPFCVRSGRGKFMGTDLGARLWLAVQLLAALGRKGSDLSPPVVLSPLL